MFKPGTRQQGFLTSKQAFVLLVLIFLTPAFVAWVMHNVGGGWQPEGTTNHGVLVHPARLLALPPDLVYGGRPLSEYLQGKWTLVYIDADDCSDVCRENLYKMRQTRIAQNENMQRVQRLLVTGDAAMTPALAGFLASEHPRMDTLQLVPEQFDRLAGFFSIDAIPAGQAGRVYIVDPLGNLMMYYPPDADPRGLLKDLQKLLKSSRIG
jgi:cytochrome oxidase Cu insertion factor (SCO1/SenC/PrrC family)